MEFSEFIASQNLILVEYKAEYSQYAPITQSKPEASLVLTLFVPCAGIAQPATDNGAPKNNRDRELILPGKTFEVGLGPSIMTEREKNVQPYFIFSYAFTNNLALEGVGIKYRFLNIEKLQAAIGFQNYGINPFGDQVYHHTKLEILARYSSDSFYSTLLSAGYYFAQAHESEGSNDGKSNEFRLAVATPMRFSKRSSITPALGIRYFKYENYNETNAYFAKLKMDWNLFQNLDTEIETSYSSFSKPTDSALFNESYGIQLSIRVRYRFYAGKQQ